MEFKKKDLGHLFGVSPKTLRNFTREDTKFFESILFVQKTEFTEDDYNYFFKKFEVSPYKIFDIEETYKIQIKIYSENKLVKPFLKMGLKVLSLDLTKDQREAFMSIIKKREEKYHEKRF